MGVEAWRPALAESLKDAPGAIGISIRNIDDQVSAAPRFLLEKAREVVAFCRTRSAAPIILGGAGYSIFPERVLDYTGADMGIQGESEHAFVMLVQRLCPSAPLNDVPGLYIRGKGLQSPRSYVDELDTLPLPGPELFESRYAGDPNYFLPIQTRRGCPLRCRHCSTATIEGGLIRKRSPRKVVENLARWHGAGFKQVYFVDNVFNLPESYAIDLCEEMARAGLNLSWRAILYPGRVSERLVRAMAEAGCKDVALGYESGVQPILDALRKRFPLEDVRRTARTLAEHGISRMGFLLLGGPGETRDTATQSLIFTDELNLEMVKVTVGVRIYPFTELAGIAVKEGVVAAEEDLLEPRFYIAPGLEEWLREKVRNWMADRPRWTM